LNNAESTWNVKPERRECNTKTLENAICTLSALTEKNISEHTLGDRVNPRNNHFGENRGVSRREDWTMLFINKIRYMMNLCVLPDIPCISMIYRDQARFRPIESSEKSLRLGIPPTHEHLDQPVDSARLLSSDAEKRLDGVRWPKTKSHVS
jgi:hypothetical protein